MAHIDDLVKQVSDPQLRAALMQQVSTLTSRKQFGLVFQEHSPESVRLPQQRVRTGDKVELRESKESATFHVISTKASLDVATVVELDDSGETVGVPQDMIKADLVVVKPFGDPVYPGLRQVGEAGSAKPGQPTHVVINGENYHALQALEYTHAGKVDLIYIDPPYNTGAADWKYNDKYIDGNDSYRHSKWLSFMEKRLKIAKSLLKRTGVIFISIDDNEHHRLRMLCDQVFGESNLIANFVWERTRTASNLSKKVKTFTEHVVCYGMSGDIGLSVPFTPTADESSPLLNPSNKHAKLHVEKGSIRFLMGAKVVNAGVYDGVEIHDDISIGDGMNLNSFSMSGNFKWGQERFEQEVESGTDIMFKTKKMSPRYQRRYQRSVAVSPGSLITDKNGVSSNESASRELAAIFGDRRFPYPKPVSLIGYLCKMVGRDDAVVVDFFAGSGTTAESVIRLNKEDGGTRQAILVTNNELSKDEDVKLRKHGFLPGDSEYEAMGVFHHVTMPRISTVLTGVREDGSKYSDGIDGQSAAFFDLTYEDENLISLGNKFEAIAPLLWMQAGATGELIAKRSDLAKGDDGYSVPVDGNYAVIFDTESAAEAISAMHDGIKKVFIVTDSENDFKAVTANLPGSLRNNAQRLYSSYLRSFEINRG